MQYNLLKQVLILSKPSKIVLGHILFVLLCTGFANAKSSVTGNVSPAGKITAGLYNKKAPPITIKGKVVDKTSGETLIGVSVKVKGSGIGTVTDVNGNFTLGNISDDATLLISYIGYESSEVPVNGRTTITISLEPSSKNLNEVVVVGYGVQKKATVTGSVVAVKGDELVKSPATNLSNSIEGRMAGVVATTPGGEPGYDGSTIRIRGTNTIFEGFDNMSTCLSKLYCIVDLY